MFYLSKKQIVFICLQIYTHCTISENKGLNSILPFDNYSLNYKIFDDLNNKDLSGFEIGPDLQELIGGLSGIFKLGSLDNASSVRIEAKPMFFGTFSTIDGFGNITSTGNYVKTVEELRSQFGFGVFVWRVSDNNLINHYSDTKIFIIP